MTLDVLTALMAFAFVTSITPGPNNLMLMASGANFGFRRTIPHMLGVGVGFTVMVVLVGVGLIGLFDRYPLIYTGLKVLSVVYLLWLAWKIATAAAPTGTGAQGTPITFVQAALFQWVNPKAWAMALMAVTLYAPDTSFSTIVLVAVVFGCVNLPSVGSWTILGQQMQRLLTSRRRLQVFNVSMAVVLVASLIPLL